MAIETFSLPDRPATLGDLVGNSFRLFRIGWRGYVSRLFWPSLFSSVSFTGTAWCFIHWKVAQSVALDWFTWHFIGMLSMVVVMIFCQWELALRSGALLRHLLQADADFESALTKIRARQWPVVVVYGVGCSVPLVAAVLVVFLLWVYVVIHWKLGDSGTPLIMVLSFVEGLLFVLLGAAAALYTSLCFAVIAIDETSISGAFRRGKELCSQYFLRGCSFMSFLFLIIFIVALAFSAPLALVEVFDAHFRGLMPGMYQAPVYLRMLDVVWGTILNVGSIAVGVTGIALYYRDLLFRLEGADIIGYIDAMQARLLGALEEERTV